MNWVEFAHARQLLADETVGRVVRRIEADEDAQFEAARRALGG